MTNLEDDPVIGKFFDTPEKKAKWIVRIKYAYILWILFIILGIISILIWSLMK
jgi:type IV secretory pathway TrbL component